MLNGGNPTAAVDPVRDAAVPGRASSPTPTYQRPILDLGLHRSANGIDEYTPNIFGSVMQGKLLIAEYSNGDDIIAVNPTDPSDRFQVASGLLQPARRRVSTRPPAASTWPSTAAIPRAPAATSPCSRRPRIRSARQWRRSTSSRRRPPCPTGYSKDYGQAYDAARGFGWVAPGTTTPGQPRRPRPRERNVNSDQRLDTFMHMQGTPDRRLAGRRPRRHLRRHRRGR